MEKNISKHVFLFSVLVFIILFSINVYSINTLLDGWQLNNGNSIQLDSIDGVIYYEPGKWFKNTCPAPIFIPTRTKPEYDVFLANRPACLIVDISCKWSSMWYDFLSPDPIGVWGGSYCCSNIDLGIRPILTTNPVSATKYQTSGTSAVIYCCYE